MPRRRVDAVGGDPRDRFLAQVHKLDVRPVVGVEIVGIDAQALHAERIALGRQGCCGLRILHRLADLLAHEVGADLVDAGMDQDVREGLQEAAAAALLPELFVARPLDVARRHLRREGRRRHAAEVGLLEAGEIGFQPLIEAPVVLVGQRPVARRYREVGGALEHDELRGRPGDHRDRLHAGRSSADDSDPLAREVDGLLRPPRGVIDLTREVGDAGNIGRVGHRQAAGRHDDEAGAQPVAAIGLDDPAPARLVEGRAGDPGVELDQLAQVEPVGREPGVAQNLLLAGVPVGPAPFAAQLRRPAVGVEQAGHVAACAGIAIPVPGAADVRSRLDPAH